MITQTVEELCDILVKDGWKEYPDTFKTYARCFYKRFNTKTPCACNEGDGITVFISVSNTIVSLSSLNGRPNYELYLCGELKYGTWVKIKQYIMPDDMEKGIKLAVPRLLAAWEAMNEHVDSDKEEEGKDWQWYERGC